MFFSIYKNTLKGILRVKTTVFWLLLYPILLATIYNLCFTNIFKDENFKKINVAVVQDKNIKDDMVKSLEDSNLFNIKLDSEENSGKLLKDGNIDAYITFNDERKAYDLTFSKSGVNQSITKVYFDSYTQISNTIMNIMKNNRNESPQNILNKIDINKNHIDKKPISTSTNIVVIYFYALLAMTSFFSISLGVDVTNNIQGNQSDIACRLCISPTHKFKLLMSSIAASLTFHIFSIALTLLYMVFILKIDFGNQLGLVFLIGVMGSFCGMAIGCFIGAVILKKFEVKIGISIGFTIFCSFLSGMMSVKTKYIFMSNFPILAKINPVGLITDGLYSLYYYNTLNRYVENLLILLLISLVFSFMSFLLLRRQKYESV